MKSVPWGPHYGVKLTLNINFGAAVSRQQIGKISKRSRHSTNALQGQSTQCTEEADPALGNEARRNCVFEGKKPRCQDGQEDTQAACSQYARAATTQYWVKVGRTCQTPLSGEFATFRVEPVLGETFMPLGCVILEGGGKAELRTWKAFGHWVNTIRKASPKSVIPEHALYAAKKIVICIQGGDTLSKKVMEDLSSEERRSVVDESSSIVLSLLKHECVSVQCQMLSEPVRRLSESALQKGLECSRRATHKWLCQALKGGAGPVHRWCGKEDAFRELPLVIRDSEGNFRAQPQCVAELYAHEWKRDW